MNTETEDPEERPKRTLQQNKAIHKYFDLVAKKLNDEKHYLVSFVGSRKVNRLWTGMLVKEFIWRPLQLAESGTTSTTQLDTVQPSVIYDHVNAFLGTEFGLYVPFPDRFTQAEQALRQESRMLS